MSTHHPRACLGPLSRCLHLVPLFLWAGLTSAQGITQPDNGERHYDARVGQARALTASEQLRSQSQAPPNISADMQELSALEVDEITGAVRSLSSKRGFLSAAATEKPMTIAMDFVRRNLAALNLDASDLKGYTVSNVVYSKVTGATHIYLQQNYQGHSGLQRPAADQCGSRRPHRQRQQFFHVRIQERGAFPEAGAAVARGRGRGPCTSPE
jgi:hypothetical protein